MNICNSIVITTDEGLVPKVLWYCCDIDIFVFVFYSDKFEFH